MSGFRLTKEKLEKVLKQSEGTSFETSYSSRNFSCNYRYFVKGAELFCRAVGKTSWADSRFDDTEKCDPEQTRRIIHKYEERFNLKGIK